MKPHALQRLATALLTGGIILLSAARGGTAGAGEPRIFEAVCDGEGVLWGVTLYGNNGLYRYERAQWRMAPVAGLPGNQCRPLRLTKRADGTAVCLWEDTQARRLFSVHRGAESKVAAAVTVSTPINGVGTSHLFADSRNNVWFTGHTPDIIRFSPDGKADSLHVVAPGESRGGGQWNAIGALEDARGTLWFYTAGGAMSGVNLRGVLSYDGKDFAFHDCTPAVKDPWPYLGPVAPKDAGHLWVSTQDGLYTLDTASFAFERFAGQPDDARLRPEFFRRGEDAYFVFSRGGAGDTSVLWRLRGDQWEKLLDTVDAYPARSFSQARVWTPAAGGIYVGTGGGGLWFLPDQGAPERLDWKRGFPVREPSRLVALAEPDRWLCLGEDGGSWFGDLRAVLDRAPAAPNARLTFVPTAQELSADRRRHLWAIFSSQATALNEWTGEGWVARTLPAEAVHANWSRYLLGVGEDQRVWVSAPFHDAYGTLIYDPAQDRWQVYPDFREALAAQAPLGPKAEPPASANLYNRARFGPGGQACYLTRRTKAAWFDGRQWHEWSIPEISGSPQGPYVEGPPFFSASGRLRINLSDKQTFEHTEEGGWRKVPEYEPGYADNGVRNAYHPPPKPPAGAVTAAPESIALDNEGTVWLTWHQQLYRCREGLCAPLFQPDEAQPFTDGRRLSDVFVDARGNAVLHTTDYVILAPGKSPPRTALELAARADAPADQAVVRLGSDAGPVQGKARFNWRLDGGAWQPLAAADLPATVTLDGLPAGPHRFEARSIDAALQTDAAPAALSFEVRVDPAAQVAGYIAQLADPDYARREAAAAALARQPGLALPALRAARAGADESRRWWLDAAIQRAERQP